MKPRLVHALPMETGLSALLLGTRLNAWMLEAGKAIEKIKGKDIA